MSRKNIIIDVVLWLSLVFVFAHTNWKISEVFQTRSIMVNKIDTRLQKIEDHVDMLDMAILTGDKP